MHVKFHSERLNTPCFIDYSTFWLSSHLILIARHTTLALFAAPTMVRTLSELRKHLKMRRYWRGLTSVSNMISSGENWQVLCILTTVQHVDPVIKTLLGIVSACSMYLTMDGSRSGLTLLINHNIARLHWVFKRLSDSPFAIHDQNSQESMYSNIFGIWKVLYPSLPGWYPCWTIVGDESMATHFWGHVATRRCAISV